MSIKIMTQVWEHAPYQDASVLLVLLALADWANDRADAWPTIPELARKARQSERNVRYVLRKLEEDGMIERFEARGRTHKNEYHINLENLQNLQNLQGLQVKKKPAKPAAQRTENLQNDSSSLPLPPQTPPSSSYLEENRQEPLEDKNMSESAKKPAYSPAFLHFWTCYPIKKGKDKCWATWKRLRLNALLDDICASVRAHQAQDAGWQEGFIPHPTTYLNGGGWKDELETGPVQGPARDAGPRLYWNNHPGPHRTHYICRVDGQARCHDCNVPLEEGAYDGQVFDTV